MPSADGPVLVPAPNMPASDGHPVPVTAGAGSLGVVLVAVAVLSWSTRRGPDDPQAAALSLFTEIGLTGEDPILLPRLPIGLSLNPAAVQGPPPSIGQHTRSILIEAGYSDAEVDDLIRAGVCA